MPWVMLMAFFYLRVLWGGGVVRHGDGNYGTLMKLSLIWVEFTQHTNDMAIFFIKKT